MPYRELNATTWGILSMKHNSVMDLKLSLPPCQYSPYTALLILGMKKLLYARNFVSIHIAFQQRPLHCPMRKSLTALWLTPLIAPIFGNRSLNRPATATIGSLGSKTYPCSLGLHFRLTVAWSLCQHLAKPRTRSAFGSQQSQYARARVTDKSQNHGSIKFRRQHRSLSPISKPGDALSVLPFGHY